MFTNAVTEFFRRDPEPVEKAEVEHDFAPQHDYFNEADIVRRYVSLRYRDPAQAKASMHMLERLDRNKRNWLIYMPQDEVNRFFERVIEVHKTKGVQEVLAGRMSLFGRPTRAIEFPWLSAKNQGKAKPSTYKESRRVAAVFNEKDPYADETFLFGQSEKPKLGDRALRIGHSKRVVAEVVARQRDEKLIMRVTFFDERREVPANKRMVTIFYVPWAEYQHSEAFLRSLWDSAYERRSRNFA